MANIKRENQLATKNATLEPSKGIKESFNATERALDVIANGSSLIPKKYSRMDITTTDGNITQVDYYNDNTVEISEVIMIADVAKSLAGTSFVFYTGLDRVKYYVWYYVDGTGSDPAIADGTGIQVTIQEDDYAAVVALATEAAINLAASFYFRVQINGTKIIINNKQGGATTNIADVDSGFSFSTKQAGASELVASLDITYSGSDIATVTRY